MADLLGKNLKALYNDELYTVRWFDALKNKLQIALPACDNNNKAYDVKIVDIKDVILILEE